MKDQQAAQEDEAIELSNATLAFVSSLKAIKKKRFSDSERVTVSQTVSFFAILYEKVRNAIEFREEHLISRAAIERIFKRRLSVNPSGVGEAENLIRELLWARYLPVESVSDQDVDDIQDILDKYIFFKKKALSGRPRSVQIKLNDFINDLVTCEVEERLNQEESERKTVYLHFFYQVLKNKIHLKETSDFDKDAYFYVACEQAFAKNDQAFIRYHLFKLHYCQLNELTPLQIEKISADISDIYEKIVKIAQNPFRDKLIRFARGHVAPFLILYTICEANIDNIKKIVSSAGELWLRVESVCREKYQETGAKLRRAAIRSIIYIFITKMLFVLALEIPLTKYFFRKLEILPLVINTLIPPFFMAAIISFVHVPSTGNTKKIYHRLIDILNRDPSFETAKSFVSRRTRVRRPILLFGFTLLYLMTFGLTFSLIYLTLDFLGFNIVSKTIFIFFISVVTFFGYRIRQTANEYTIEEKSGIFSPIFDFFFMPILALGKFLSQEIAKLNVFILIFDFIIEAPFKLFFEIIEEWINFVKARKDEIV